MGKRQRDQLLKLYSNTKGGSAAAASSAQQKAPIQPRPAGKDFDQRPTAAVTTSNDNDNGTSAESATVKVRPLSAIVALTPSALVAPKASTDRNKRVLRSAAACDAAITDEELRNAVAVLEALQGHPDLFRTPRYKALRAAVYPLVQPPSAGGSASLVNRVSDAVADSRWADAMIALAAMRSTREVPKLGSVQRWVRDCDLAGADEDPGLLCLDAILRTAAPEQICPVPTEGFDAESSPVLLRQAAWEPQALLPQPPSGLDEGTLKSVVAQFRVLLREPAAKRRPANLHDMILYTCDTDVVPMRPAADVPVEMKPVPFVPASLCLNGVLSPQEATSIVQIAEAVGMTPDVPLTGKKSILAHHFVWMADEGWITNVFERCRRHLPAEIHGAKIVGLNRRLRCYRYVSGSVYRPHVDGAWPMSGIDEATGAYVYDISRGRVTSKLTFLLYLNEGFGGGCTTYYTPAYEEGHLRITPVAPRCGSVMVFPHADTAGCLVHEGSAVTEGAKYIIRTEVLYELPPGVTATTA